MTVPTGPVANLLEAAGQAAIPEAASPPPEDSYRWAAVTQLDPLRVQLDGENLELPITPDSLVNPLTLRVGTRVWAQLHGRRVVILGASSGGSDVMVPIGGIVEWAGSAVPNSNWAFCDGASLLRASYPDLYAVCGTTFGSVDGTHFNLPDYRDRVPVGMSGTKARGSTGGEATHTLTAAELPAHTHTLASGTVSSESAHTHAVSLTTDTESAHSHPTGLPSMGSGGVVATGSTSYAQVGSGSTSAAGGHDHSVSGTSGTGSSHTHTLSGNSGSIGSGEAHENLQPYLAVPFIIRVL